MLFFACSLHFCPIGAAGFGFSRAVRAIMRGSDRGRIGALEAALTMT